MWTRHEARPTTYEGTDFRSALEAAVAVELDKMGVKWAYEVGVDGVNYLPDFTILDAPDDLLLPRWVEVKPSELLYAVRDHFGVEARFVGERWFNCSSDDIKTAGLEEIWKPKKLSEHVAAEVLVVSQIARNRTLSIEMWPAGIVLSRDQPCVNWRQVTAEREAEHRQRERAEQYERERQQRQKEQAFVLVEMAKSFGRPAQYDGWCQVCGIQKKAPLLVVVMIDERWRAVCKAHLT
jgi:hypothetical protein